jgi:cytochrome c556
MNKAACHFPLALIVALILSITAAGADVISDRKAGFKSTGKSLKAIRTAISENDTATIAANAEKIAAWFAVVPDHFPEGSGEGDTDARPEIWTDWDRFTGIAASAEAAALDLAKQANAGNSGDIEAGFRNLAGTCKTCHQSFRRDR